ncbi:MAG: hypothetical protein R3B90_12490 [Planctomycetaceae bacterium]
MQLNLQLLCAAAFGGLREPLRANFEKDRAKKDVAGDGDAKTKPTKGKKAKAAS